MSGTLASGSPTPRAKRQLHVGIIELLTDTRTSGWVVRAYARVLTKQFASITPQAVAIWSSGVAYALAKLFGPNLTLTVIGGPTRRPIPPR